MTPSDIKLHLHSLGGRANKQLGQHFLIDTKALSTIVDTATLHPADTVIEIGPGLGVLTQELLAQHVHLLAIEKDKRFLPLLQSLPGDLTLISADATDVDLDTLVGSTPWKLVANLPYAISSYALRLALWSANPADRIVVLVQREVGERALATAPTKKTSLLSLMIALSTTSARIIRRLPPGAFYPPPKVDSVILELVSLAHAERLKKWGTNPESIMAIAKLGFAHPRKKLLSNLAEKHDKHHLESIFNELHLSTNIRAEDMSPEEWAELAKKIEKTR